MKLPVAQKIGLGLLAVAAAVTLCVLPFLAAPKEIIYIYTQTNQIDSREQGLANELKRLGYEVKINDRNTQKRDSIGLWFSPLGYVEKINRSQTKYNFIYSENYYPLNWNEIQSDVIVLTPYQDLYEHYVRSNVKSAKFTMGVNLADFSLNTNNFQSGYKEYPVIYYGDNTLSPLAERLRDDKRVKFLGSAGEEGANILQAKEGSARERGIFLSKANIVALYNAPNSPETKYIVPQIMEAAASGALVFSTPNEAVKELYGDNVIIYENMDDFNRLVSYYLNHPEITNAKIIAAQKITAEKLSSEASAQKLHQMIEWLNQNRAE